MPNEPDRTEAPAAVARSFADWMRAEVTLTLQRRVLVAAGMAAFALLLIALD